MYLVVVVLRFLGFLYTKSVSLYYVDLQVSMDFIGDRFYFSRKGWTKTRDVILVRLSKEDKE